MLECRRFQACKQNRGKLGQVSHLPPDVCRARYCNAVLFRTTRGSSSTGCPQPYLVGPSTSARHSCRGSASSAWGTHHSGTAFGSFELLDFGHTLVTHFVCSHHYCLFCKFIAGQFSTFSFTFWKGKVHTGCMRLYHCGSMVEWVVFAQVIFGNQATNGLDYTGIAVCGGGDTFLA